MSSEYVHYETEQQPAPDRNRARQKAAILVSISRGATRARACEAAGIPRRTFYNWIEQHPGFRDQVEDAEQKPVALAEAIAIRSAMKAEDDPRYLRALFHFLKHRAGWGASSREEAAPSRIRSYDPSVPDPDAPLTAALYAEMQAAEEPRWGIAVTPVLGAETSNLSRTEPEHSPSAAPVETEQDVSHDAAAENLGGCVPSVPSDAAGATAHPISPTSADGPSCAPSVPFDRQDLHALDPLLWGTPRTHDPFSRSPRGGLTSAGLPIPPPAQAVSPPLA